MSNVVANILQETFEHERYQTNVIVYGVSESDSFSLLQRISDDKLAITDLLFSIKNPIPMGIKLVKLGRATLNKVHSLKILFKNKDDVLGLVTSYSEAM